MRHLLSREGREALAHFSRPGTLLGLDYDGTLAPIRVRPSEARIPKRTRTLLEQVSQEYPLVVITGRSRRDAQSLLGKLPDVEIIGNHGIEHAGVPLAGIRARVAGWRAILDEHLRPVYGVAIEDKGYSLTVHYRLSRKQSVARAAIVEVAANFPDARLVGGKAVVNIVPRGLANKGTALLAACRRRGATRAIYIGDDETDEDVFALNRPRKILTVRIGSRRNSRASFYLESRLGIQPMLRLMLELRRKH